MERCSKCVIPETYPGIQIDSDGLCNFCRDMPEHQAPRRPGNPEKLLALIAKHRLPDSPYDCAVALSGGRDSTYVLYYAVRVLGLRVLAFTVDHGLLPEHTRENIRKAVSILKVAHVMEPHTAMERSTRAMLSAWLHRPSAATVSLLCLGCRRAMFVAVVDAARRNGTPVMINGTGEAGDSRLSCHPLLRAKGNRLGSPSEDCRRLWSRVPAQSTLSGIARNRPHDDSRVPSSDVGPLAYAKRRRRQTGVAL